MARLIPTTTRLLRLGAVLLALALPAGLTAHQSGGTTPVLKGTPQEYLAALGQTTTKVFVMNPGDRLEF